MSTGVSAFDTTIQETNCWLSALVQRLGSDGRQDAYAGLRASLHVLRDRNPMAVRLHVGAVRDGYTLKIANRSFRDKTVEVSFSGIPGARLKTPGAPATPGPLHVVVEANESRAARVFVIAPAGAATQENTPVAFTVRDAKDQAQVKSVFTLGAAP